MPKPKPIRYLDDEFEFQDGDLLERNGNLTLVERRDGSVDWYAPFELDEYIKD